MEAAMIVMVSGVYALLIVLLGRSLPPPLRWVQVLTVIVTMPIVCLLTYEIGRGAI